VIVLDASAGVELLLATRGPGARVRERLRAENQGVHVPHLFDVEIMSVIRRLERGAVISRERAVQALHAAGELPLVRYPHWPLQRRVWGLRENVSAYDAVYLALAEALDAILLTADRKLEGVPGATARVEVID
jgi:predicted nucleic acid-binding protein